MGDSRRYMAAWRRRLRCVSAPGTGAGPELFHAGTVLVAFLIIGLVVDGGLALDRMSDARYVAQEAARAKTQQTDPGQAVISEAIVFGSDAAQAAARAFLNNEGVDDDVALAEDVQGLTVTVHDTCLPRFGVGETPVTEHGTATLLHQSGG